jgi:hypothetical protein
LSGAFFVASFIVKKNSFEYLEAHCAHVAEDQLFRFILPVLCRADSPLPKVALKDHQLIAYRFTNA